MQFMVTYEIAPENRSSSGQRFLETGGLPPKGRHDVGPLTQGGGAGKLGGL